MRKVVHFVGAGLTKSLQLDGPMLRVPLMADFVAVMADHVDDDVILTALVGLELAGLFEWVSEEASVLAEPLALGPNRTPEARRAFAEALQRRPSENIETLLLKVEQWNATQRLSLRAKVLGACVRVLMRMGFFKRGVTLSSKPATRQDVHRSIAPVRFNYSISRFFSLLRWNLDWRPLEQFLTTQLDREHSKHTFISFNYDLALEHGLQRTRPQAWSLRQGYGFEITHSVRMELIAEHARQFETAKRHRPLQPDELDHRDREARLRVAESQESTLSSGGAFAPLAATEVTRASAAAETCVVLKPHGSLNWLVNVRSPYQLNNRFGDGPLLACADQSGLVEYIPPHGAAFELPMVQVGSELPQDFAPYILAPGSKQSDSAWIRDSREREVRAILGADEIFVIGWSVPPTDGDQADLIRSTIARRPRSLESLTVVNQNASPDYFRGLSAAFSVPAERMRVFNAGFADYVKTL